MSHDVSVNVILQDILHTTEREDGPRYRRACAITDELEKRGLTIAPIVKRRSPRRAGFYRGLEVGRNVEYASEQVRRGLVITDEQVKLLREYDPDALIDTPYDK